MLVGVFDSPPSGCPHPPPLHTTMFPCIALVMPFSRDTLTQLNMMLVRLNGAKSLRDPLLSQLLGEWVASSPLARGPMVRGHAGWLPLPYSRQAKGGREAIYLPPLPSAGPHRPPHGLERPQAWLPAHDAVYDPPGVGLHGSNGPPVPQGHRRLGCVHGHVEGVGHPP